MKVIGVDVGGTFTDLIYCDLDTGAMTINKVPTKPQDPSQGVMNGVEGLLAATGESPHAIDFVFHATTTATNAVLEDKGANAGMITNQGFRDILHIGRHQRVEHYSIRQELPWQNRPLIKRRDRMVVGGRLAPPHGEELEPLDEEAVRERGARPSRRRRRIRRDLLSVLLPQSGARGARQGDRGGNPAGCLRDHLLLRLAAVSRVRAIHDGRARGVYRAQGPHLHHSPRPLVEERRAFGRPAGSWRRTAASRPRAWCRRSRR